MATVLRAQPVVPLPFVVDRLKPPMKPPHVIFALFSRSPMFLPVIIAWSVVLEHTSKPGSTSLIIVKPPYRH